MTVTTNGAECGEPSPLWGRPSESYATPRPSHTLHPRTSYPGPPRDQSFAAILARACSEVDQMMEIPINARLEGEAKVTQYNDLLTKRLDALQKEAASVLHHAPTPTHPMAAPQMVADAIEAQTMVLDECKEQMKQAAHAQSTAGELTLRRLGTLGLPLKYQREMRDLCPALAGDYSIPVRQDLSVMWERAERHLRALGPEIEPHNFGQNHIEKLGPLILGEAVWREFSANSYRDWDDFKKAVEERYGLSRSELLDAFYDMSPMEGESEAQFILKVERLRIRYRESASTCFRQFKPRLRLAYREELANATRAANLISGTAVDMDWAMLVKDATSMVRYSSLVPEKATHVVRGLNQVATVQPAQGVPAVAPVQTTAPPPVRRSPRAPSAYAAPVFASSERHCELCALVGRENADSHTLAFCYANPKNAEHKAWRVRARYRDIKRANLEMPDCMKEYAAEQEKSAEGPKKEETKRDQDTKKIKKQMASFGADLQTFVEEGLSYQEALEESYSANFGVELSDASEEVDPCPAFMMMHLEPEEEEKNTDLQALSKPATEQQRMQIRRHLSALNQFSDADLQAIGEDMEGIEDAADPQDDDEQPEEVNPSRAGIGWTPQQPMYNPHRPGPSFGPSYGAPATRETAVNTGGVAGAGRVVRRPKPDVPLGRQIDKMRILIPLFKGLGLKENLRRLLLAQSTLEAARQGETVRIVRGTPVQEVTASELADEIRIYSEAGLDESVAAKIRSMRRDYRARDGAAPSRKRDSSMMMRELVGSLRTLLNQYTPLPSDIITEEEAAREFNFLSLPPSVPAPSSTATCVHDSEADMPLGQRVVTVTVPPDQSKPEWASEGAMNLRGLSDLSPAHYSAVCELGKGVVDMMLDTGGARTMIDLETAMKLGLPVERVSATKYFGSFYSASGVPTPYAGRVKGPVTIRFSKNVVFTMRELKVINYPESLLLVGTDLLGGNPGDGYTFAYVGVNPISKMGEIVFAAPGGASLEACELVLWPTATSVLKATSPPPRVSFAEPLIQPDPLADSDRDPDALEDDARRFLALVRNQGQRL